jgi:hypothetical protein
MQGSVRIWLPVIGLLAAGLLTWRASTQFLVAVLGVVAALVVWRRHDPPASILPSAHVDGLQAIELEALRQQVDVMGEALDSARADMLTLADVAEKIPPNRVVEAIARLARLSGMTTQEPATCAVGDILADRLAGTTPGAWRVESDLPTLFAPPQLLSALIGGLAELGAGAVDQVRCGGRVEGGMALIEVFMVSGDSPAASLGFHVAERAATLLGGGLWHSRCGASDRILVVVPVRFHPSVRMTSGPAPDLRVL